MKLLHLTILISLLEGHSVTVVHARHDLAVRIPQALIHEAVLLW